MKKFILLAVILLGATPGFAQSDRGILINGKTIPLNESNTYKFKVEEGNKLNFYENTTKLETVTLTETPTVVTPLNLSVKNVIVGAQSAQLFAGTVGSVTFPVTTAGIADGETASITWYTDATGNTEATRPTGITTSATAVSGNACTLTVNTTNTLLTASTRYFRVTIDGEKSNIQTFVISPAGSKTVTVGAQSGTITQGVPYETVSFPISTSGIAGGTYAVTLNGAPTGISLFQVNTVFINSAGTGTLQLEGNSTGSTPAGNYPMTITIDGTTSAAFTLTISGGAGKTVTVGAQVGTMTQGKPYETVSFPITSSGIAGGTYTVTLNGAPAGISLFQVNTVFINSAGNGTLELEGNSTGSTPAGNHSMSITINGTTSNSFTLKIGAASLPNPTAINFGSTTTYYTYPGRVFPVNYTLTPSGADESKITWTTSSTNYQVVLNRTGGTSGTSNVSTFVNNASGYAASVKETVTYTATLPNSATASVTINTRFAMVQSFNSDLSYMGFWNQGVSTSWQRSNPKMYVRAYYPANATEWARPETASPDMYLTEIGTGEYSITSNDTDVTLTKMADGVTYELTRNQASGLKEVTLTITVGSGSTAQSYTQEVTLLN